MLSLPQLEETSTHPEACWRRTSCVAAMHGLTAMIELPSAHCVSDSHAHAGVGGALSLAQRIMCAPARLALAPVKAASSARCIAITGAGPSL